MCKYFQFSVRDLFWLTLVVSLTTGWSMEYHSRLEVERDHQEVRATLYAQNAYPRVWETGKLLR
jgi:hypothetical protein